MCGSHRVTLPLLRTLKALLVTLSFHQSTMQPFIRKHRLPPMGQDLPVSTTAQPWPRGLDRWDRRTAK